jgi:hypothetical protein
MRLVRRTDPDSQGADGKVMAWLRKLLRRLIKMVKLHAASMFIKDPVDVWGKEKNIGLAEHSARRLAPPITSLVEQGNLIYYDGYESGVQKYELHQVMFSDRWGRIAGWGKVLHNRLSRSSTVGEGDHHIT